MAVYKLFPTQDATIYSLFPNMNTGLDEIIEATETSFAYSTPNPQTSRFLINFSETEIDDLLDNKEVNMSYLPDGVEKQIYKNLLVYGLNIVKEVISTSKIEIAGHEITFNIKPVENVQ